MLELKKESFAFLVLVYNQANYVIEHLESIRYLVEHYGQNLHVDLLISDDCSRDDSVRLIHKWLNVHSNLFRNTEVISNNQNLGTCKSLNNLLEKTSADRIKITAADDVYSFENIFELTRYKENIALVSGIPLILIGNELQNNRFNNLFMASSQVIYQKKGLWKRFKNISITNAPSVLYSTVCLKDKRVIEYMNRFAVTEDWPLQLSIGKFYNKFQFLLINKVLVYYRRTTNSSYISSNQRFVADKLQIFTDLIHEEKDWFFKIRLKLRKKLFKNSNRWMARIVNIDYYIYFLRSFIYLKKIIDLEKQFDFDLQAHRLHLNFIKQSSAEFLKTSD